MNKPFHFKQFTVQQDRCEMKIGTDGVLLGAWTSLHSNPFSILDIGAGTGIIALQMAQRSTAELIDAIEIDENAYEQCVENFEASPWGDRLFCYHASLDEFTEEMANETPYDLIVSNPPFYSEDYTSGNISRDTARFTEALPFEHLLHSVSVLLSERGFFSTIIPKKEETAFIEMAKNAKLFPNRICRVRGTETSEEKRSLIEFSFQKNNPSLEKLTIETSRHQYTGAYQNLVRDFYLKM